MIHCPLNICDGSGLVEVTDWTGGGPVACACRVGAEVKVMAGLQYAGQLEAEARYYPGQLVDVGIVTRSLRIALGMISR